jgi:hypothetical protein
MTNCPKGTIFATNQPVAVKQQISGHYFVVAEQNPGVT